MSSFAQTALPNLTFTWEDLLGLLRDELQEYGSLLGLLSAQQQSILERRPESLLEINQTVQTQMEASQILQKKKARFCFQSGKLSWCFSGFQLIRTHSSFSRCYPTNV